MATINEIKAGKLIEKIADDLKTKMNQPQWTQFVKTGVSRERTPQDDNWYFIRSASILRRLYFDGPVGISRLRTRYGGLHRRGHKPARFAKGSGKLIRTMLQSLEELKLVEKDKKGRKLSTEGQRFLDGIAKKNVKG